MAVQRLAWAFLSVSTVKRCESESNGTIVGKETFNVLEINVRQVFSPLPGSSSSQADTHIGQENARPRVRSTDLTDLLVSVGRQFQLVL